MTLCQPVPSHSEYGYHEGEKYFFCIAMIYCTIMFGMTFISFPRCLFPQIFLLSKQNFSLTEFIFQGCKSVKRSSRKLASTCQRWWWRCWWWWYWWLWLLVQVTPVQRKVEVRLPKPKVDYDHHWQLTSSHHWVLTSPEIVNASRLALHLLSHTHTLI